MMYQKHLDLINLIFDMQASLEGITYEEIQKKFNCSRRTAERIIESIAQSVFELEQLGNRPKRWRLSHAIPGPPVNAEQVNLLQTATKLFEENNMKAYAEQTAVLLTHLRASMSREALEQIEVDMDTLAKSEGFVAKPGPRENIDVSLIDELRTAVLTSNVISFNYQSQQDSKSKRRTVHPYGFLSGSRRYLVAKDPYSSPELFKYFRLVKISDLNLHPGMYFPREDDFSIASLTENNFGVYHERPSKVVWRFDPSVAEEVREWQFHHSQTVRTLANGRVEVSFYAGGTTEMAWHLVTWGDKVNVLKPPKLIRKLQEIRDSIQVPD